jgi:hypothetical protein
VPTVDVLGDHPIQNLCPAKLPQNPARFRKSPALLIVFNPLFSTSGVVSECLKC